MALDEFSLIDRYFRDIGPQRAATLLGIGDDAAVVGLPQGHHLVVSMDTLIGGVHFDTDISPADIAYKSLAVNLSDLAAMAASPSWFQLSLSLPELDDRWLRQFANGLRQTADTFGVPLIGGDTCRGPLSITIQVAGQVPGEAYVTRAGAGVGDLILVSGELGNAALGLAARRGEVQLPTELLPKCEKALNRPRPRLELALFLREFASAAIDLSDGLQADLGHILQASASGASLQRELIPVDGWIRQHDAYHYALAGGDDYEICCCVPAGSEDSIRDWNHDHPECKLTPIGEVTASGYHLHDGDGLINLADCAGYRHFE